MTGKTILKDLSGVLADVAAITKLAHELQAKTDTIRKHHELDDTEDEDVEAASNALLAQRSNRPSAALRKVRMS